jgi:hypothetical protein
MEKLQIMSNTVICTFRLYFGQLNREKREGEAHKTEWEELSAYECGAKYSFEH